MAQVSKVGWLTLLFGVLHGIWWLLLWLSLRPFNISSPTLRPLMGHIFSFFLTMSSTSSPVILIFGLPYLLTLAYPALLFWRLGLLSLGLIFQVLAIMSKRVDRVEYARLSALFYMLTLCVLLIVLGWLGYVRIRKLRQATPVEEAPFIIL